MSVVTKTGDDGKSRWNGRLEDKDSPLLEAIGAIDELSAVMQMVGLNEVADDLWGIMGELAYEVRFLKYDLRIKQFENDIKRVEENLPKLSKFTFFKTEKGQKLNWARTVARRVERRVVYLKRPEVLKFFNRLSDYLFILARKEE